MNIEEMEAEFERLQLEHPIVLRGMELQRYDGMLLEQALKYMVVYLAKESATYREMAIERSLREPIGFKSRRLNSSG